jgi:tight adherence protein B
VALEILARALRAGVPLTDALRDAGSATGGPVGEDLATVARDVEHGAASAQALEQWMARRAMASVRLAVAAIVLGTELGGSRAHAIDRVASSLRQRAAAGRQVRALAGQARLSAVIIVTAPLAFALVSVASSRDLAWFLFATPLGWVCLSGGLALDAAAAWWMSRIVRSATL